MTACAHAPGGVHGELAVRSDGAGLAAQHGLDLIEDQLRALYVAGGAKTYADPMLTLGIQGEQGVERGDAIDLGQGDIQTVGNELLHLNGEVAVDVLSRLHHGHGAALHILILCNDLPELRFLLRRTRKCNQRFLVWHIVTLLFRDFHRRMSGKRIIYTILYHVKNRYFLHKKRRFCPK